MKGRSSLTKVSLFNIVSRVKAKSDMYNFEIEFDVNSEIFPVAPKELYKMVLTDTISDEPTSDGDYYSIVDSDS